MSRNVKRILLAIGGLLVAAVGAVVFLFVGESPGGMRPTYQATDYDSRLTSEARTATRLLEAIQTYHRDHGTFPADTAALATYLPVSELHGWDYHRSASGYTIWRKLGWDPSLRYQVDGASAQWVFDPGDGSPEKVIQLRL